MYERNAIVLERYFSEIFNFKNNSNLKENYYNYRKLFECYGILCNAKEKEMLCKDEFNAASKEITKLQKTQEKLYNKSAKYEYSRYIIFSNTEETSETIEKHLNKVNEDVQKNNDDLKELGEKFVQAINDYNTKQKNLEEATTERENANKAYDEIYLEAKNCYSELTEEIISNAKDFISSDNKENKKQLQEIFENNGKKEKNQFDPDVISNTISKSIDIYKIEMDVYLIGLDRISKLFEEIENDSVKNEKHLKYCRDSKAKINFLNSEKDYIIQFLDNERIGAIYDKKTHRKLMLESCKKFILDFAQIDKLYDIITKEIAGRSTKKIYKENYNKEYIIELENASIEPSLDTGKMRQDAIAFVNLNYWRIEGMKSVYDTFEEVVTTLYDKDLSEFIPEELKEPEVVEDFVIEENAQENIQENVQENEECENNEQVEVQENVVHRKVYYSSKVDLANAIYYSLQNREFAVNIEEVEDELEEMEEKEYASPEVVQEILGSIEEDEILEDDVEEFDEIEINDEIEVDENNEEIVSDDTQDIDQNDTVEFFEAEEELLDGNTESEEVVEKENVEDNYTEDFKEAEENGVIEQQEDFEEFEDEEIKEEVIEDNSAELEEKVKDDVVLEETLEFEESEVEKDDLNNEEVKFKKEKAISKIEKIEKKLKEKIIDKSTPENFEDEDLNEVIEELKNVELEEDVTDRTQIIETIDASKELDNSEEIEDNNFDLSKLDEIDDEFEEDKDEELESSDTEVFEEDDDDSILEIYFCDNDSDEKEDKKSIEDNLKKKKGFFQKLVGLNSREKRKA